jgi:hypothetical protein
MYTTVYAINEKKKSPGKDKKQLSFTFFRGECMRNSEEEVNSGKSPRPRIAAAGAIDWVSRVLAVLLVMVAPGMLGSWLDRQLATRWLTAAGFLLGMLAGMVGLVVLVARFHVQYPARGKALVDEEPQERTDRDREWE